MTIGELQKEFLPSSLAPEDFFVLLSAVTGKDKAFLLAHPEHDLDAETEARTREYFARRLKREPVAYIVGHKEFYGRDFLVTPDTLIPRPETELIIELILDKIKGINRGASPAPIPSRQAAGYSPFDTPLRSETKTSFCFTRFRRVIKSNIIPRPLNYVTFFADIGTGSGNIVITLAKEIQEKYQVLSIRYHATDISPKALEVARKNAERHGVGDTIAFHEGSLLEPIFDELATADEVIVAANLPYLSEEIYQAAEDDVKRFEPRSALVSDRAGLDHYYRLLDQIKNLKKPTTLFLEISPEQTPLLRQHLAERFPQAEIFIHQDLSARDRVVEIHL